VSRIFGSPFKALDVLNNAQQHYDTAALTKQQLKTSRFPFNSDYEDSQTYQSVNSGQRVLPRPTIFIDDAEQFIPSHVYTSSDADLQRPQHFTIIDNDDVSTTERYTSADNDDVSMTRRFKNTDNDDVSLKSSLGYYVGNQKLSTAKERYTPNTDLRATGAKSKLDLLLNYYSTLYGVDLDKYTNLVIDNIVMASTPNTNRKQKRQLPTDGQIETSDESNAVDEDSYIAHMFGKRMTSRRGMF